MILGKENDSKILLMNIFNGIIALGHSTID